MAIWFITGTSTGFGREITLEALARGDKVIATARKLSAIEDLAEKGAYTLTLDITSPEATIKETIAKAVEKYGGIDILVNNAGVGLCSTFEEVSDEELRALFNVNYFGHANVTRAVLPYMRSKKSGVIGFIGSGAGRITAAGASAYVASKSALAGFSGCLRDEVKAFDITVTTIEPGFFRTPMLTQGETGSGGRVAKRKLEEYNFIMDPMMQAVNFLTGKEPGDPVKGAKVIVDVLKGEGVFEGKEVPARLVLGKEILAMVQQFKEADTKSLEEWKAVSESTEFDGALDLLKDLV